MKRLQLTKRNVNGYHALIVAILIVKILCMGLFSSDYQNALFMRFIYGFLEQITAGNWVNPYELFRDSPQLFPYPPAMLAIESAGGLISYPVGNIVLKNILFKLPNLAFDCLGMWYLTRMFPNHRKYIVALYFASPIVLYSTYMHGQLDIIPTTLLLGAIFYLTSPRKNSRVKYVLLLALALACKFHILAVVPILFLYVAKRDGWRRAAAEMAVVFALVILCVAPLWGEGFRTSVLLNNEQSILTKITLDYTSVKIFIPIMAVVLVYLRTFTINRLNKDLLYSLCGILFGVFLVLIPPMPGWYVWIVPFVTVFFIDAVGNKSYSSLIYAALNILYLLYFLVAHQTEYVDLYFLRKSLMWLKTDNSLVVNGLFTLMTAVLAYSIYMMYQSGIASNSFYKHGNLPFVIGVAGDSGSGKSTFTEMVQAMFDEKRLLMIEGDGDHKWERGNAMWERQTHLNPKSNYLYRQAQDLAKLREGESVSRIDYDHDTGGFTQSHKISPKPYILLCGLHALYLPQVRSNLDLKIYMDVDETLRRYWKIQRDIAKRSYDKEKILDQIQDRMEDAEKYIYPQKQYADLVISYFDRDLTDCLDSDHEVKLGLKATLDISINLEPLIQRAADYGISIQYDYDESLTRQSILIEAADLEGKIFPADQVARELIPHLDEIINHPLELEDNLHSILAIILLLMISRKLREG